jgi:hypothetical protein
MEGELCFPVIEAMEQIVCHHLTAQPQDKY